GACVKTCMQGVEVVYHTATLHKPHIVTHSMQDFIKVNIQGTLALLEAAAAEQVKAFIFTSTTSMFGDALRPPPNQPAAWVTEEVIPIPKNIYGTTKTAAEDLCHLFHRRHGLNCIILRTSRFFLEQDDDKEKRQSHSDDNLKANEFLYRRVDLEDIVSAHLLASEKSCDIRFGRDIISATTPFLPEDLPELRTHASKVLEKRVPEYEAVYQQLDWQMFKGIDRVYVNTAARNALDWSPKYDFAYVLQCLQAGQPFYSPLARLVGTKGYHPVEFEDGPYPVED
ncbi:MAG: NAD(P)-dependent oxidoreductase, partial [Pseudomonadota bacterium]